MLAQALCGNEQQGNAKVSGWHPMSYDGRNEQAQNDLCLVCCNNFNLQLKLKYVVKVSIVCLL